MTLSFYIARRFATYFGMVFGSFLLILFLIDIVEQLRRAAGDKMGAGLVLQLAMLNVPGSIYNILPLITILAAIAMFLNMARSSELVVVRASGRSALRILVTPLLTIVAIGIVLVAVLNPIVAATSRHYDLLTARLSQDETSVVSLGRDGLWLRQGGPTGQTVIHATLSNADGSLLSNVGFYAYHLDGTPVSRIEAATAELTPDGWALTNAKRWSFTEGANPEQSATLHDTLTVATDLTLDQIRDGFGAPGAVAVWDLPKHIQALNRAGFSTLQHQVLLQMELALPLLLASMVLIAAGFTLRHARSGHTGVMVLMAVGLGFAIFFLRNFAQILGENGQIPVIFAAWSAPLAATLLSLGLLLHLEDG